MHIHLPKPLHGWKEFANEIFVIVIGVLIALGFEQVVEWVHWQHKVAEGEEMLAYEAQRNFGMQLEAYAVAPCIDAQIAAVRRNLEQGAGRQPLPRYADATERYVMRLPSRAVYKSTWESLIADGTLNHMPKDRAALWGAYFQAAEKQNIAGLRALEMGDGFVVLANPGPLSADARLNYLDRLEQFAVAANRSRSVAMRGVEWYRKLGLEVPEAKADAYIATSLTGKFCLAHGLPLANWRDAFKEKLPPMAM